MIRLSVDIIWLSRLLLNRIIKYNLHRVEEIYLSSVPSANLDSLVDLASKCNWINNDGSTVHVNERGYEIAKVQEFEYQAREILTDYIKIITPSWAKRIPYGRKEAFIFMTKDEKACFFEAGLMNDDPDEAEIKWWDQIANYIRSQDNLIKAETGRKGELCTIQYERNRVGEKPQWVSIDSNLSGYDIISQVSSGNKAKLLIEVKSSGMSLESAEFIITAHEWHTACNSNYYSFYLWCFHNNKKQLAVIEPISVLPYIPTNNQTGEWQTVSIPFRSFRQMFTELA